MSLDGLFAYARSRSLVPLLFVGTVASRRSARWLEGGALHGFGDFIGAGSPRQADLLVVVGEVPHKAAPTLQRLYARMADPSYVLWVTAREVGARAAGYATVPKVSDIVPVDVVIEGDPPTPDALAEGMARLRERVRARGAQP